MSWPEVLELAHAPESTHNHRLGRAHGEDEQTWLTPAYIAYALKLVTRRLNSTSVTPGQYRQERTRMLAVSESRWLHGRRLWLPTDEQIRLRMRALSVPDVHRHTPTAGTWDAALALAGLESEHRRAPAVVASGTVELLERCYTAHGTEPSALELRRFAKANGIPWTPDRHRTWRESVAAWKQQRREQGLAVPDGPPPRAERPDYAADVGAARADERRRQDWSDIESCLLHVIAYLEQLAPGERSSKKNYNDWALAVPARPAYSAFDQHGGWGRLRRIAHARMLRSEDS
jgi:hypothetical protein